MKAAHFLPKDGWFGPLLIKGDKYFISGCIFIRMTLSDSTLMRVVRRIAIGAAGFAVILVGVTMLVLPGPGILVILGGISILAIEFPWAKRILRRCQIAGRKARARFKNRHKRPLFQIPKLVRDRFS